MRPGDALKPAFRSTLESYGFIFPAVLIFSVFYVYPFIQIFHLSFFEWDGIVPFKDAVPVGWGHFREIFFQDAPWWQAMRNAGFITIIALTLQNVLAFLLALACDREIRLKNFYALIFFVPVVLSEIVVGMTARFLISGFEGVDVVNRMLGSLGLVHLARNWLSGPHTALTTVALVHCWKGFGWGFLIFLAGLQTIPRELYEAARVDGAGAWGTFRRITVPLIMPVIGLVAILTVLGTMQIFALIIGLVGGEFAGHTSVPVLRILSSMQGSSRFGYACAQGIVFGMALVVVSFFQYRLARRART